MLHQCYALFRLLTASSKDEQLKAILREATVDGKSKQFIEIWDNQHLNKSYDLSAFDLHGDVYAERNSSFFHFRSIFFFPQICIEIFISKKYSQIRSVLSNGRMTRHDCYMLLRRN